MSMKFIANIMLFLFDFKKPIHYDRWNKWNTPVGGEGETKRKNHDSPAAGGLENAETNEVGMERKELSTAFRFASNN